MMQLKYDVMTLSLHMKAFDEFVVKHWAEFPVSPRKNVTFLTLFWALCVDKISKN